MRKLMLLCAGLALFASVTSVMLWRDLHAERERSAQLQSRLDEADGRMARTAAFAQTVAPAPSSAPSVAAATNAPTRLETIAPEAPRTAPAAPVAINTGFNQREMLKDPEYRKAMLAQLRMSLPTNYPGLAEELGLSPEQADRLFDLLAENQMELQASTSPTLVSANGQIQIDQTQMQEMQRVQQELRAKQDAAMSAMLGEARMSRWQEYQQTQSSRLRVQQLGRTLDAMGAPLTSAQMRPLTEAMAAEQLRQRQEMQAMFRELRPNQQPDSQMNARLQEENFKRQAESNRRLVDAAAAHLNPRQLELFRTSLEQQLTMNRASSRLQRETPQVITVAPVPAPR